MKYGTIGKNFFIGYPLDISVVQDKNRLSYLNEKDCYKILFLERGSSIISLNNTPILLDGPSAVCLNQADDITIGDDSEIDVMVLLFHPSVINDHFDFDTPEHLERLSVSEGQDYTYLWSFTRENNPLYKVFPLNEFEAGLLKHRIEAIERLLEGQEIQSWPCSSRSYLFEILFSFSRADMTEKSHHPLVCKYSELTVQTMLYLHSCYNQKITIETICRRFHVNRTTLMNEFKDNIGKSIHQYLMQLRVSMAGTLLRGTKLPLETISDKCGFTDLSYFCKTFKRQMNMTPQQYRAFHATVV